jgi:hypothetical protein
VKRQTSGVTPERGNGEYELFNRSDSLHKSLACYVIYLTDIKMLSIFLKGSLTVYFFP